MTASSQLCGLRAAGETQCDLSRNGFAKSRPAKSSLRSLADHSWRSSRSRSSNVDPPLHPVETTHPETAHIVDFDVPDGAVGGGRDTPGDERRVSSVTTTPRRASFVATESHCTTGRRFSERRSHGMYTMDTIRTARNHHTPHASHASHAPHAPHAPHAHPHHQNHHQNHHENQQQHHHHHYYNHASPHSSGVDGADGADGADGGETQKNEKNGESGESDKIQDEMPDRDELRDQLEWDLGVASTLSMLKELQIQEQIAMERRGRSIGDSNRRSIEQEVENRRRSAVLGTAAGSTEASLPARSKRIGVDYKLADELRSKSQRALFEGLANTADMSRDRWFIVRADGRWRMLWVLVGSVATITTVIVAPLVACSVVSDSLGVGAIELFCDVLFMVDVALHFVTAYQDELRDIIVTSPVHIRKRYLRGLFVLDALAAAPFDWLFRAGGWSNLVDAARMCKLLRVYGLLGHDASRSESQSLGDTAFNPSLIALCKLIASIFLIWHWTACIYSLISTIDEAGDTLFETDKPWIPPPEILAASSTVRYIYATSWAIGATCMTFRPDPRTMLQRIFSDLVTIVGFVTMAGIVGSATTAIGEYQAQRSETSRALQTIARYMRRKHLPRYVRRRVLSYYRFHQSSMNILEQDQVLFGLPRALRVQISLIMHKPIFVQLPLFWLCAEEEMLLIVSRLRPVLVMPGEMLVKEGTIGVGLFLLMKGAVETTMNGQLLVVLLATAAFGETSLRGEDEESSVTVRALRFCETSVLLREDWALIERINPNIRQWLNVYILERDRNLKDKRIQLQSEQTRKATLRCGGSYKEWDERSRFPKRQCPERRRPITRNARSALGRAVGSIAASAAFASTSTPSPAPGSATAKTRSIENGSIAPLEMFEA